jgi:hypothetical protein
LLLFESILWDQVLVLVLVHNFVQSSGQVQVQVL